MGEVNEFDVAMMRRAMALAMRGRGMVEPNPMVGCVIVKEGRIIGAGYHEKFGAAHAEPNALASCIESPEGATAYVTLEPCCHTNKKTPPCVPAVIEGGIARVVAGTLDPNAEVNGRGLEMLRAAGVEVNGPVLETEAKQLIAPFIAGVRLGRPYVTLKWAETGDGKVAGAGGRPMRISNGRSTRAVHELRARSQAIVVGIGTVLSDDPQLTVRDVPIGAHGQPVRVVLDADLRLPPESLLVRTAEVSPVWVYHAAGADAGRIRELTWAGVQTRAVARTEGGLDLRAMLQDLRDTGPAGLTHVLVEAGPTLARGFFGQGLADRVWVFRATKFAREETAPSAAVLPESFEQVGRVGIEGDVLAEYLDTRGEAYFAPVESADLVKVRETVQKGSD